MEVHALTKYARMSPKKVNEVARVIRGKSATDALDLLKFTPRKSAALISKTLESAIANAENNHSLDVDRLYVKRAHVGKGLVMKRFRARAKGRGARILKPFSHLTIVVGERGEQ